MRVMKSPALYLKQKQRPPRLVVIPDPRYVFKGTSAGAEAAQRAGR